MQNQKQQACQTNQAASERRLLLCKLAITSARVLLYVLSIKSNGFQTSSILINVSVGVGLYVLLGFVIYYRSYGFSWPQEPFSIVLTLVMHLFGLANLVVFALSIKLQDVEPEQFFFQIFMSQMVNYVITLIVLHDIFAAVIVTDFKHFLKIYQPVEDTLIYLFIAHLVGTLFDFFAFQQVAVNELYILLGILLLYALTKTIFFNNLIVRVKNLFAE